MKKTLVSIAITSVFAASSSQALADQYNEDTITNEDDYTAIGIGAVGGALVGGPVGFIVGGYMGSLFDSEDDEQLAASTAEPESESLAEMTAQRSSDDLRVASSTNFIPQDNSNLTETPNRIKDIVINNLNVAVYFKPGSVDFESFYTHQFSTISNLLHEMPEMELKLEGYSDRQGTQSDNLQLSAERLESVRDYFVNSGIDASRINVQAYGEKNFLSTPGELDSYIFDRRVVVSFKAPSKSSQNNVATASDASSL